MGNHGPVDYDLTRLGTREFEHVTQALALGVLGPAVSVFGDGPDGGREATFNGRLLWSVDDEWDGHVVIQAKHRQRPLGTREDTVWLLQQVDSELARWDDPTRNRSKNGKRPDYLIISTNVVLSGVPRTGGIDSVNALIARYASNIGLRGWRVWHFDQLSRMLDNNESVRRSFAHFITPGDVLARIDRYIDVSTDLARSMAVYVEAEMLANKWIRLAEAGHTTNGKVELASTAIDLPARWQNSASGEHETVNAGRCVIHHADSIDKVPGLSPHIVIVGGPGQGKTTLGQLVCQLYRVAMIGTTAAPDSDVDHIAGSLRSCFTRIDLPSPIRKRWPIRVELAKYADAIAGGEGTSLLRYMAEQVSNRISDRVTASMLKDWLRAWPWLVVLDGLDEVAAASSRDEVLVRITDFLVESRSVEADVSLVVTTRPQGYGGEFHGRNFEHLNLMPLEAQDAIAYAQLLARVRHSDDPDLRDSINARMRQAAGDLATARLMTSPLQVTIMSLLLEARERAPQARYALFDAYYSTMYAREMGKPGPIGTLLEENKRHVDAIHDRVGLLLHCYAESAGESDAALPRTQLRRLTIKRLTVEGHEQLYAERLADRIIDAATSRLVLLVAKNVDHVGYEVRSLQEFAAARALTEGTDDDVIDRLRVIATSAHWRNPWLFAAGRLFVEREHLRGNITNLLNELDVTSELNMATMPGAELALELLADDVARSAPTYQRILLQRGLKVLDYEFRTIISVRLAALDNVVSSDESMMRETRQHVEAADKAGRSRQILAAYALWKWREGNGALAKWARQYISKSSMRFSVTQRFLMTHQIVDAMPKKFIVQRSEVKVRSGGNLAALVGEVILARDLHGSDRRAAEELLKSFKRFELQIVSDGTERNVIAAYLIMPDYEILVEALARKNVADAVAFALHSIPDRFWGVAGSFQAIIQVGAQRIPTVHLLEELMPELRGQET